ncbi:hypothetical protein H2O64_14870 [Kordia sp. YSTF-M3]|uniref:HD domain-containing protein n=1 Tax=Kordia aestuariivivens TaxID=2759037 RepID=A0ABR7QBR9_9FLAO|nr:hypothetical protein [Kordia aestuariivivens]MBC8755958.1 hypothetical protein [Kordia aestuariivivens]
MENNNILGSYAWGIRTKGNLNTLNKLNLSLKAIAMKIKGRKSDLKIDFDVDHLRLPDSSLVQQTLEYINDVHKEPLKNHCLRSFAFGDIFGNAEKIKYDRELYALSALLHDLGLEDSHCCLHDDIDCFAIEGAKEAGFFLSKNGLNEQKIAIVQDSIAFHLNLNIPKPIGEAYLLNKASATDTIGLYKHELSEKTVNQILEKYPRLSFNLDIHEMLKKQCKIRPKSRITFLYKNGFGGMLKENRFSENVL